jgi:DNA repair exonuclease SbcCD nuclease subunit
MVKKIVHIADLHIRTYQLHELYRSQFEKFISELETYTLEWADQGILRDEVRIVIAGDIAHQKINISNEQLLLTSWFIKELTKFGKVVIIPGNHDFLENNHERLDSISPIIELLNDKDISYYKDMGVYDDEDVKWVVYSLYQHNQRPEFVKEDGYKYIGLFHGAIQGMKTDLGFEFDDAYDRLNFINLDLLLCGDIHLRQTFKLPSGGLASMVGSFIQQNFGEHIEHHGYGIYDVESNDYQFFDIASDQPFMHFKIKDIKDIEDETEKLVNAG